MEGKLSSFISQPTKFNHFINAWFSPARNDLSSPSSEVSLGHRRNICRIIWITISMPFYALLIISSSAKLSILSGPFSVSSFVTPRMLYGLRSWGVRCALSAPTLGRSGLTRSYVCLFHHHLHIFTFTFIVNQMKNYPHLQYKYVCYTNNLDAHGHRGRISMPL